VVAQTNGPAFREKMLITHRGLSGPAMLQVSSYWEPETPVSIDLAPGRKVISAVTQAKTRTESVLKNAFAGILPKAICRPLDRTAPAEELDK